MDIIQVEYAGHTDLIENSHWVLYTCMEGNQFLQSWLIVPDDASDENVRQMIENHISVRGGMDKFPNIYELEAFLTENIIECHTSDNEMWFVEAEDILEKLEALDMEAIQNCINKHNLGDYVKFYSDDAFCTIYGGISTVINWTEYIDKL